MREEEALDPTTPFMTLDITRRILGMVEDLPNLANYLTTTVRDLTGARLAILFQCSSQLPSQPQCVLSVTPEDAAAALNSPAFTDLFELVYVLKHVTFWEPHQVDEPAVCLLAELGYEDAAVAIPLVSGDHMVGALLGLGLPDDLPKAQTAQSLEHLAGIVALALRNSELVCEQEAIIRARTKKLQQSEKRFRSILESVPKVAVQGYLPDGTVRYWNRASEEIYGYTAEEAVSRNLLELIIPPDMHDYVHQHMTRSALTGEPPPPDEYMLMRKDGSRVPVFSSHLVVVHEGETPEMFCIDIDLSEQKEIEARLRHSDKMDAVGQLAGGVAHDFNNQLTPIIGFAEILSRFVEDDSLRGHADKIVECAKRSSELVKQLLAFSRKGNFVCIKVDIHEAIGNAMYIMKHSVDKKIQLHCDLSAGEHVVMGDPTQIESAILNLGLNARDAMPDGGDLHIETKVAEFESHSYLAECHNLEPGRYVEIRVKDNGCGIPTSIQDNIFDPFFSTKGDRGTGLGLAAVYGTVRSMNGAIEVDSRLDHGTTFHIFLPAFTGEVHEPDESSEDVESLSSLRILVVDDEIPVRETAGAVLEALGHSPVYCANGKEAVSYYRDHWQNIDLVILDIVMPVMSGREAFLEMKDINPNVRALLASGYSLDGEAQSVIDAGAGGFLQKPFLVNELATKIAEVVS